MSAGTQSVDRAAQLLAALLESEGPLSLRDLADAADLPKSSLEALSEASGETINIAVPTPYGVEHLAQVEARHFLGAGQWVGRRVEFHCTANGKIFLAWGAAELPPGALRRRTPSTITDRAELARALETVRRDGVPTAAHELEVRP